MSLSDGDIADGVAALLATDTDPAQAVTWQPDGSPYDADATGVFIADVPDAPNRIVTVTVYGLGDDPVHADSDRGIQIRSRGTADPHDVDGLDGALADVLLGRAPFTLPNGIRVQQLTRTSSASLGKDAERRWSRVSNFTGSFHRPGTHRL